LNETLLGFTRILWEASWRSTLD